MQVENYNREVASNLGNMHQSIFVVPKSKTKVAFNKFFDLKRCLPNLITTSVDGKPIIFP